MIEIEPTHQEVSIVARSDTMDQIRKNLETLKNGPWPEHEKTISGRVDDDGNFVYEDMATIALDAGFFHSTVETAQDAPVTGPELGENDIMGAPPKRWRIPLKQPPCQPRMRCPIEI